ncbi:MAG TPA: glycosyltransferase [Candidatus Dormibacteraeota bacterium]
MRVSREGVRRTVAGIGWIIAIGYISWRLIATLNPDALWFAIPVWLAEAFGVFTLILSQYIAWDIRPRHEKRPAPQGLKVDVLVPSYNEALWVVRRTLVGALKIRYPHRTYLLDDGRRPEMKELAEELDCGYITRADNIGAKAGNLNNALAQTDGDLIAIFDADHIAMANFLDEMLGYFVNEKMAFVQSPQEYYNFDSFQHRRRTHRRVLWHEQSLFYRVHQPGRDRFNAVFFCGSCGVIRRKALEQIGGFATETVTEDLHTSIKLHRLGWESAYEREVLALGLAPQTPLSFHQQRLRWGQGTMQVMRKENFLLGKGLTLHQRLNYLACGLHYFEGLQRSIYYLAPAIYLLTGILPIRAQFIPFVPVLLLYYGSSYLGTRLMGRGYALAYLGERFQMVRFFTYIRSLQGLVFRGPIRFAVTSKRAEGRAPVRLLLPSVVVGVGLLLAQAVGVFRVAVGWEHNIAAFVLNLAWSGWILTVAVSAAWSTIAAREVRGIPRTEARLPVLWWAANRSGVGVLKDLTERGAALQLPEDVDGDEVSFAVMWPEVELETTAAIRRHVPTAGGGVTLGLEWDESQVPPQMMGDLVAALNRRSFETWEHRQDYLGKLELPRHHTRRARRRAVCTPVSVQGADVMAWGATYDVSRRGVRLLFPRELPDGASVLVTVGDEPQRTGKVAWARQLPGGTGSGWVVGIEYAEHPAPDVRGAYVPIKEGHPRFNLVILLVLLAVFVLFALIEAQRLQL